MATRHQHSAGGRLMLLLAMLVAVVVPGVQAVTFSNVELTGTTNGFAKTGDTLTLTFIASEEVVVTYLTIGGVAGANLACSTTPFAALATTWTCAFDVTAGMTGAFANAILLTVVNQFGIPTTETLGITIDNTAPTIDPSSVTLTGGSNGFANTGDTIILRFETSEDVQTAATALSVTLNGATTGGDFTCQVVDAPGSNTVVSGSPAGKYFKCTYTVQSDDPQGAVRVLIKVTDLAGNDNTDRMTAFTPDPNVVIDTVAPTVVSSSATSSNTVTNTLAKTDEVIILRFKANEAVTKGSVAVNLDRTSTSGTGEPFQCILMVDAGNTPAGEMATSGMFFKCTYTVVDADPEEAAKVLITMTDLAGNTEPGTTATIPNPSVVIDNAQPIINTPALVVLGGGEATNGGTFKLTFTANENVTPTTITIGDVRRDVGECVTPTSPPPTTLNGVEYAGSWVCEYEVTGLETQGPATLELTVLDIVGTQPVTTMVATGTPVINLQPTVVAATIVSNNDNGNTLAKATNTLTLHFTASEDVVKSTVVITVVITRQLASASVAFQNSFSCKLVQSATDNTEVSGTTGKFFECTYVVAANDVDGEVKVLIEMKDTTDKVNTDTKAIPITLTPTVTIDNTRPTISPTPTLTGGTNGGFAKEGAELTLTFTAVEAVKPTSLVVNGGTVTGSALVCIESTGTAGTVSGFNTAWSCKFAVTATMNNGPATLDELTVEDQAGNTGPATSLTLSNPDAVTIDKAPPTVDSSSATSNNAVTTLAKKDDRITLTFTASKAVKPVGLTVATVDLTGDLGDICTAANEFATAWTCTFTVTDDMANGPLTQVTLTVEDKAENQNTGTSITLSTLFVTIDRAAPIFSTVTLVGPVGSATATNGEMITLSFAADEKIRPTFIEISNVERGDLATKCTAQGPDTDKELVDLVQYAKSWVCTYPVTGLEDQGSATLLLKVRDIVGNPKTVETADVTGTIVNINLEPTVVTGSATITSSNTVTTTLAKAGDTITLHFTASEEVTPPVVVKFAGRTDLSFACTLVTFPGGDIPITVSSGKYVKCTYVVQSTADPQGLVGVDITMTDTSSTPETFTTTITPTINVDIDTDRPTILTDPIPMLMGGTNGNYAKVGDTLTLTFTASEPVKVTDLKIGTVAGAGRVCTPTTAASNGLATGWSCDFLVTDTMTQALVDAVMLTVEDKLGNTNAGTSITLGTPKVTIDTTAPTFPGNTATLTGPGFAKAGTTLTLTFTALEPVAPQSLKVSGQTVTLTSATCTGSGTSGAAGFNTAWSCQITVLSDMTQGDATVTELKVKDRAGNPTTAMPLTLSNAGAVKIDTLLPPFSVVSISPAVVREGDNLVLTVTSDEPVTRVVTIAGKPATCTPTVPATASPFTCSVPVVRGDPAADPVPFTVQLTDLADNVATTTALTTGQTASKLIVTVDSISLTATGSTGPSFRLIPGDELTLVVVTTEPPTETPVATFGGVTVPCTLTEGTTFACSRTVLESDPLGPIAVSVVVSGRPAYTVTTDGSTATRVVDPATEGLSISMFSSNALADWAKTGDRITVRIASKNGKRPVRVAATILSRRARCFGKPREPAVLFCTINVLSKDTNGLVPFSITTKPDRKSTTTTVITKTSDASAVRVDTVKPLLSTVSIASTSGDRIKITLVTNEAPRSLPVATVGSIPAPCVSIDALRYECTTPAGSELPRRGRATFSATIADRAGNAVRVRSTTDNSSVTFSS